MLRHYISYIKERGNTITQKGGVEGRTVQGLVHESHIIIYKLQNWEEGGVQEKGQDTIWEVSTWAWAWATREPGDFSRAEVGGAK